MCNKLRICKMWQSMNMYEPVLTYKWLNVAAGQGRTEKFSGGGVQIQGKKGYKVVFLLHPINKKNWGGGKDRRPQPPALYAYIGKVSYQLYYILYSKVWYRGLKVFFLQHRCSLGLQTSTCNCLFFINLWFGAKVYFHICTQTCDWHNWTYPNNENDLLALYVVHCSSILG